MKDGTERTAETAFALGNPENPMQWPDMKAKFIALTQLRLGQRAEALFEHLRTVESKHQLVEVARLCAPPGIAKAAE
jgi:2-methylcitrate dehydratase PrpD